jgi:hypothetical protein
MFFLGFLFFFFFFWLVVFLDARCVVGQAAAAEKRFTRELERRDAALQMMKRKISRGQTALKDNTAREEELKEALAAATAACSDLKQELDMQKAAETKTAAEAEALHRQLAEQREANGTLKVVSISRSPWRPRASAADPVDSVPSCRGAWRS